MKQNQNDLIDYMRQATQEIQSEYERIHRRAASDPGTAGDEGEENWAEIIKQWLPDSLKVVTKGQLLTVDGKTSPQVDIIVLEPNYPKALINKKKYLIDGIVAVFECKVTIDKNSIHKTIKNCAIIKKLIGQRNRNGSPYKELTSPIVFGLLAHSSIWKSATKDVINTISSHLLEADKLYVKHPSEMMDLLCIPSLGNWRSLIECWVDHKNEIIDYDGEYLALPRIVTSDYMCHYKNDGQSNDFTPIGHFIASLWIRISKERHDLRRLSEYFNCVLESNCSESITTRDWSTKVYSNKLLKKLNDNKFILADGPWDEWNSRIE